MSCLTCAFYYSCPMISMPDKESCPLYIVSIDTNAEDVFNPF